MKREVGPTAWTFASGTLLFGPTEIAGTRPDCVFEAIVLLEPGGTHTKGDRKSPGRRRGVKPAHTSAIPYYYTHATGQKVAINYAEVAERRLSVARPVASMSCRKALKTIA